MPSSLLKHLPRHLALLGLLAALACAQEPQAEPETPPLAAAAPTLAPDHIFLPEGFGRMESPDHLDPHGQPLQVRCSTCHAGERGVPMKTRPDQVERVHAGLQLLHGTLVCASCHAPDDRDLLRLADGRTLPFEQINTLCGQCHGTQHRDYKRGAHGGMQGHWDRTRGPTTRNACVVCHDPHAPAIPQVMPAPGPRDRAYQPSQGAHP